MPEVIKVTPDFLSLTTVQITIGLLETDNVLATASGFIYSHEQKMYLITNWHNVTGRDPISNHPLSNVHAGIPDVVSFHLRLKDGKGRSKAILVKLYEDDQLTRPKWLIHPKHKHNVDVVALELEPIPDVIFSALNMSKDFDNDIAPEVSDDAFIIGYPFEELRALGLPIWKKASIASEPTMNEDRLPKLLVDTATRSGLSGAPVIYQRIGIHRMKDGSVQPDSVFGRIRGFLGIYSGRIGKDEMKAQLGIVWKRIAIEEILKAQIKGDIEFQKGAIVTQ